ncbi:N-acetylmuramoyl-L-alanine amidase [Clostridium perfringens]|uniref:N-acetylmuramoyl-L-alanine amidase n=1 Tax=Clostridium perfringens TaxID=1502 RepID=UPI001009D502|nr:N-acetylmuramoyl-L-alanine amidase [Clostridium perfringens]MDU4217095.1 N-acetylmuramoyl-L-alanine amidase [Clostridium perfringens]RXI81066.1 N-acetylmuramoyl-L-alanine amidase [Clostridium perfringens]RXI84773.1 N-acetylmuramoyl-L-alanine amidase [Clostridium perfringens]RXI86068.1 N-acetylmuramoyl-L-alanine amidase [Clostridium perfringens]RXI88160.1 N-acetylmuramoyl-L-alanine amidase [Clostridium perfringens]
MKINKRLSTTNVTLNSNNPKYIIIHETDNTSSGAGAETHCKAQANGNIGKASVHYYVDDTGVYQAVEHKHATWNCGDGNNRYGINNKNTISIEICVNSDSDYNKAVDNTVELVRYLKNGYYSNCQVVRHYDASRKNCPRRILANGYWNTFLERVNSKDSSSQTPANTSYKGFYESSETRTNATLVGEGSIKVLDEDCNPIPGRCIDSLDNLFVLGIYPSRKFIEVIYPAGDKKYHAYIGIEYYNRISFDYHKEYINDDGVTYVWWNASDVNVKDHNEELQPNQKASPMYRTGEWLRITFYRENGVASDGYVRYEGSQNKKFYENIQYGIVKVNSSLNVRETPNGEVIGSVYKDEKVQVLKEQNGWYYIEYSTSKGKKRGYVSSKYIELV